MTKAKIIIGINNKRSEPDSISTPSGRLEYFLDRAIDIALYKITIKDTENRPIPSQAFLRMEVIISPKSDSDCSL